MKRTWRAICSLLLGFAEGFLMILLVWTMTNLAAGLVGPVADAATIALFALVVTVLSCWLPARRAASTDPIALAFCAAIVTAGTGGGAPNPHRAGQ